MNSERIVWLGIRSFGVFLSYQGVQAAINLFGMILLLSQTRQSEITGPVIIQQFLLTAFYLGSGVYLLFDGSLLFDRLVSEGPIDRAQPSIDELSIRDDRKDA
jgi:hypothetical protein